MTSMYREMKKGRSFEKPSEKKAREKLLYDFIFITLQRLKVYRSIYIRINLMKLM